MRTILISIFLSSAFQLSAQIIQDSIIGSWTYNDGSGRIEKLIITSDSVTVVGQHLKSSTADVWDTVSYTGRYTIISGNIIHVIFWDDPREEQFYEIIKQENSTIMVQLRVPIKKKHGEPRLYRRE